MASAMPQGLGWGCLTWASHVLLQFKMLLSAAVVSSDLSTCLQLYSKLRSTTDKKQLLPSAVMELHIRLCCHAAEQGQVMLWGKHQVLGNPCIM